MVPQWENRASTKLRKVYTHSQLLWNICSVNRRHLHAFRSYCAVRPVNSSISNTQIYPVWDKSVDRRPQCCISTIKVTLSDVELTRSYWVKQSHDRAPVTEQFCHRVILPCLAKEYLVSSINPVLQELCVESSSNTRVFDKIICFIIPVLVRHWKRGLLASWRQISESVVNVALNSSSITSCEMDVRVSD